MNELLLTPKVLKYNSIKEGTPIFTDDEIYYVYTGYCGKCYFYDIEKNCVKRGGCFLSVTQVYKKNKIDE